VPAAAAAALAAPAAVSTGAVSTGAVSAGVSVTKVVVITAVSAVVGVSGAVGGYQIFSAGPCDSVVADRPLETVLAGSVRYLDDSAFSFHLRYGDDVDAEGSADPVARTASFTLRPPGTYVGEVRVNGDDVALSGPVAGTAAGEWTHTSAASQPVAQAVTAVPKTVATMLAGAERVERDGCDFSGRITFETRGLDFTATIEDGTGDLRRLTVAAADLDLELTRTGPAASAPPTTTTTTTAPPRTDLTGRWVNGPYALVMKSPGAGIMYNDTPVCSGDLPSSGAPADITFRCVPGSFFDETFHLHVEPTGQDLVDVTGYADLDGTYQLAQA
jgi:hypothetical protein